MEIRGRRSSLMEFKMLLIPMAVASFLVVLTPSSALPDNISFSFPSFDQNVLDVINLEGDAVVNATSIQLTKFVGYETGWATYGKRMHLWDESSGKIADFSTRFSFVIDSQNSSLFGDGFAFFLAPPESRIHKSNGGGGLALPDSDYMAVEFDTFTNEWDPGFNSTFISIPHIGIDIRSYKSNVTKMWEWNKIRSGGEVQGWITYNSSVKNLSVLLTDKSDPSNLDPRSQNICSLSYQVNLSSILPEWVKFGLSASTGGSMEIHRINSWEFNSTFQNIELSPPPSAPSPSIQGKKQKWTWLWVVISCVGAIVLFITIVLITWFHRSTKGIRNSANREEDGNAAEERDEILRYMNGELEMEPSGPRKFSYSELAGATGNFKPEVKLGEGGFGAVYRGLLQSTGSYIAVKRISSRSKQGIKEYASEVKIISRLRHRNLVQLIGCCHERMELLLVYEFMPNGSLDSHLFKGKSFLPWMIRYKIAQDLTSALLYLHEEWEQCVVHRDIKSSNIMLDSDFNAKLGDFGLARLVDHSKGAQTTVLAGTIGYMAPECSKTLRATKESDIYSFGMVCLEIACGRRPVDPSLSEDQIVLVEWVWSLHRKGEILKAADSRLGSDFDERQMEKLLIIGLSCTLTDSHLRPSAKLVLRMLEADALLPVLPARESVGLAANISPLLEHEGDQHQRSPAATGNSNQSNSSTQVSLHSGASVCSSSVLYVGR